MGGRRMNPWLTVVTSAVVAATISGAFSLRAKRNEYVNGYYDYVVKRRIAAYEHLEKLILQLKSCVVEKDDKRPYHLLFSSEKNEDWEYALRLLGGAMSEGLWLSNEVFEKLTEMNYLIFHIEKPDSVIEFARSNYKTLATFRVTFERLLATDMLNLHNVKRFLRSKNKPDPGFNTVRLKY
jgi:hypothetical protein